MSSHRIPIKYNVNSQREEPKFQINGGKINMLDEVYEFEGSTKTTLVNKNNISLNTAIKEMKKYYENLDIKK
jgi:hypothetical protein